MAEMIPILVPYAERIHRPELHPLAPRLATLEGRRLGFVYNTFLSIGVIHDELRRLLAPRGTEAIAAHKKYWRPLDPDRFAELAERADAVVGGLGNTSPSTVWAARDAIAFERRGRPTVTFATRYFEDLLTETVAAEGMPDLRRIILPSPLEDLPEEALRTLAVEALEPVVAALTRPAAETVVRL